MTQQDLDNLRLAISSALVDLESAKLILRDTRARLDASNGDSGTRRAAAGIGPALESIHSAIGTLAHALEN